MPNKKTLPIYRILFLGLLMTVGFAHAQKEPQYTQYMYNIGSFNPAYVGTVESPEIIGLYRAQWVDIPGAPTTIRGGANIPFNNEKMGLGINIVNDVLGPSTQTYFDVAYSYQIQLSEETKLSFGINAGGSSLNIDYSKGTFEDPSDGSILGGNYSNFYPTVGAGLFMYHKEEWYLGASVPNFLTDELYNDEVATIVEDYMQLNVIGGYVFELGEQTKFKPAFLVNYLQGSPVTVNLSANFQFIDALTVGASYRLDNAVSGLAGFQISNGMFIGYSYDYNTNNLGEFSGGSHEAILKFYIGRGGFGSGKNKSKNKKSNNKGKQIDSPRFF
ncbi:type IX secretion system membrane protein PorP/SprF [Muricauda sp. NFXS6]|tara:strand:+ start:418 stop:1407 length:990 start_codon:yes stop_codon:yes gene_type:complete